MGCPRRNNVLKLKSHHYHYSYTYSDSAEILKIYFTHLEYYKCLKTPRAGAYSDTKVYITEIEQSLSQSSPEI
ncbi:hypothetical protein QTP88_018917 [Uroleucon formosanum]